LLLGLDSRRGDEKTRCDAIHLITFSPPEDKIIITSVSRNTHVDLPEVATPGAYLANVCEERGVDESPPQGWRFAGDFLNLIIGRFNFLFLGE